MLGRFVRRALALLLSLAVILLFYVFAVMMEGEQAARDDRFVVEAAVSPLSPMQPIESREAATLAQAFGVALPIPERFEMGRVADGRYHGYATRTIYLRGSQANLTGIRPASAAAAILPAEAAFLASGRALLGYPLLEASTPTGTLYALITTEAAFVIQPLVEGQPGGFSMMEPSP